MDARLEFVRSESDNQFEHNESEIEEKTVHVRSQEGTQTIFSNDQEQNVTSERDHGMEMPASETDTLTELHITESSEMDSSTSELVDDTESFTSEHSEPTAIVASQEEEQMDLQAIDHVERHLEESGISSKPTETRETSPLGQSAFGIISTEEKSDHIGPTQPTNDSGELEFDIGVGQQPHLDSEIVDNFEDPTNNVNATETEMLSSESENNQIQVTRGDQFAIQASEEERRLTDPNEVPEITLLGSENNEINVVSEEDEFVCHVTEKDIESRDLTQTSNIERDSAILTDTDNLHIENLDLSAIDHMEIHLTNNEIEDRVQVSSRISTSEDIIEDSVGMARVGEAMALPELPGDLGFMEATDQLDDTPSPTFDIKELERQLELAAQTRTLGPIEEESLPSRSTSTSGETEAETEGESRDEGDAQLYHEVERALAELCTEEQALAYSIAPQADHSESEPSPIQPTDSSQVVTRETEIIVVDQISPRMEQAAESNDQIAPFPESSEEDSTDRASSTERAEEQSTDVDPLSDTFDKDQENSDESDDESLSEFEESINSDNWKTVDSLSESKETNILDREARDSSERDDQAGAEDQSMLSSDDQTSEKSAPFFVEELHTSEESLPSIDFESLEIQAANSRLKEFSPDKNDSDMVPEEVEHGHEKSEDDDALMLNIPESVQSFEECEAIGTQSTTIGSFNQEVVSSSGLVEIEGTNEAMEQSLANLSDIEHTSTVEQASAVLTEETRDAQATENENTRAQETVQNVSPSTIESMNNCDVISEEAAQGLQETADSSLTFEETSKDKVDEYTGIVELQTEDTVGAQSGNMIEESSKDKLEEDASIVELQTEDTAVGDQISQSETMTDAATFGTIDAYEQSAEHSTDGIYCDAAIVSDKIQPETGEDILHDIREDKGNSEDDIGSSSPPSQPEKRSPDQPSFSAPEESSNTGVQSETVSEAITDVTQQAFDIQQVQASGIQDLSRLSRSVSDISFSDTESSLDMSYESGADDEFEVTPEVSMIKSKQETYEEHPPTNTNVDVMEIANEDSPPSEFKVSVESINDPNQDMPPQEFQAEAQFDDDFGLAELPPDTQEEFQTDLDTSSSYVQDHSQCVELEQEKKEDIDSANISCVSTPIKQQQDSGEYESISVSQDMTDSASSIEYPEGQIRAEDRGWSLDESLNVSQLTSQDQTGTREDRDIHKRNSLQHDESDRKEIEKETNIPELYQRSMSAKLSDTAEELVPSTPVRKLAETSEYTFKEIHPGNDAEVYSEMTETTTSQIPELYQRSMSANLSGTTEDLIPSTPVRKLAETSEFTLEEIHSGDDAEMYSEMTETMTSQIPELYQRSMSANLSGTTEDLIPSTPVRKLAETSEFTLEEIRSGENTEIYSEVTETTTSQIPELYQRSMSAKLSDTTEYLIPSTPVRKLAETSEFTLEEINSGENTEIYSEVTETTTSQIPELYQRSMSANLSGTTEDLIPSTPVRKLAETSEFTLKEIHSGENSETYSEVTETTTSQIPELYQRSMSAKLSDTVEELVPSTPVRKLANSNELTNEERYSQGDNKISSESSDTSFQRQSSNSQLTFQENQMISEITSENLEDHTIAIGAREKIEDGKASNIPELYQRSMSAQFSDTVEDLVPSTPVRKLAETSEFTLEEVCPRDAVEMPSEVTETSVSQIPESYQRSVSAKLSDTVEELVPSTPFRTLAESSEFESLAVHTGNAMESSISESQNINTYEENLSGDTQDSWCVISTELTEATATTKTETPHVLQESASKSVSEMMSDWAIIGEDESAVTGLTDETQPMSTERTECLSSEDQSVTLENRSASVEQEMSASDVHAILQATVTAQRSTSTQGARTKHAGTSHHPETHDSGTTIEQKTDSQQSFVQVTRERKTLRSFTETRQDSSSGTDTSDTQRRSQGKKPKAKKTKSTLHSKFENNPQDDSEEMYSREYSEPDLKLSTEEEFCLEKLVGTGDSVIHKPTPPVESSDASRKKKKNKKKKKRENEDNEQISQSTILDPVEIKENYSESHDLPSETPSASDSGADIEPTFGRFSALMENEDTMRTHKDSDMEGSVRSLADQQLSGSHSEAESFTVESYTRLSKSIKKKIAEAPSVIVHEPVIVEPSSPPSYFDIPAFGSAGIEWGCTAITETSPVTIQGSVISNETSDRESRSRSPRPTESSQKKERKSTKKSSTAKMASLVPPDPDFIAPSDSSRKSDTSTRRRIQLSVSPSRAKTADIPERILQEIEAERQEREDRLSVTREIHRSSSHDPLSLHRESPDKNDDKSKKQRPRNSRSSSATRKKKPRNRSRRRH